MPELAQTNVQLVRQLVAAGWCDDDLGRVRRAYELVMWVYSAQYRGTGKTQIAHHIGAASALVASGARAALATAALVHSVYFFGEFGSGRRGAHPEKRAMVRDLLGDEIERLAYEYPQLKWSADSIRAMTADADAATAVRRDVVALRVANAVDEYTDGGMRLAPRPTRPEDLTGERAVDALVALAEAHGHGALATLLRAQATDADAVRIPTVLITPSERAIFVPPASHRRRAHIALQNSRVGHAITETVPGARQVGTWLRRRIA